MEAIMEKTVIIYASTHHGNTFKLVKAIAEKYDTELIDATKENTSDLSDYGFIGFASGIDFGKFYRCVEEFLENNLPENKKVFFIYTSAKKSVKFTRTIKEKAEKKNAQVMGEYGCKGFNTYGPWKIVGGMNKNHPTNEEIAEAVQFFKGIIENK